MATGGFRDFRRRVLNRHTTTEVIVAIGAVVLVASLGVNMLVVIGLTQPQTVLKDCSQPDSIKYRENATYHVYFRRTGSRYGNELAALVGRTPLYGVPIDLVGSADYVDEMHCEWTADAVTIIDLRGVRHTVPASFFTTER